MTEQESRNARQLFVQGEYLHKRPPYDIILVLLENLNFLS